MELPLEPLSFLPAKSPFASVSSGVPINHENFIIATPKTPGSGLPILQVFTLRTKQAKVFILYKKIIEFFKNMGFDRLVYLVKNTLM